MVDPPPQFEDGYLRDFGRSPLVKVICVIIHVANQILLWPGSRAPFLTPEVQYSETIGLPY